MHTAISVSFAGILALSATGARLAAAQAPRRHATVEVLEQTDQQTDQMLLAGAQVTSLVAGDQVLAHGVTDIGGRTTLTIARRRRLDDHPGAEYWVFSGAGRDCGVPTRHERRVMLPRQAADPSRVPPPHTFADEFDPLTEILSTIKGEHIDEMRYLDCWAHPTAGLRNNALYIALTPGVAWDWKRGSCLAGSTGGGPPG